MRDNSQQGEIVDRETGAALRILGSDAKRAHGRAPQLVICDEPSQWPSGTGEQMMAALRTAKGKIPNARLLVIGTRPRSDLHFFARMLASPSETRYTQIHAATDLDAFADPVQWQLANPGLIYSPDLRAAIQSESKDAANDPGLLASFRALRLNGGISETDNEDLLVEPSLWKSLLEQDERPPTGPRIWGLDLGSSQAMSAVSCCWGSGRVENLAVFGAEPDLVSRALRDGCGSLYEAAHAAGELLVSRKRVPDIRQLFEEAQARWGRPDKILIDRWRASELADAIDDISWQSIPLITRGMGYRDGAEDVRGFRKACAEHLISPVKPSILLTGALSEAVVTTDPAGNSKLAKGSEADEEPAPKTIARRRRFWP